MTTPKLPKIALHGVLLLDKPRGFSSNQALQKVKRLLRAAKGGHTGTLDPLATGVLPLCFGAATKFSQLQLDADKEYSALARLGITTTTYDLEGETVRQRTVPLLDANRLEQVKQHFSGQLWQLPPMHSALKYQGRALYEYAREGQTVERTPRLINIKQLDIKLCTLENGEIGLKLRINCSKGTYIRSLVADIGEFIGCGAHLVQLIRTAVANFSLEQCLSLEQLEQLEHEQLLTELLPLQTLLGAMPVVQLDEIEAGKFLTGLRRRISLADAEQVAVVEQRSQTLLGVGAIKAEQLIAKRLLNPQEIEQILLQQNLYNSKKNI